VTALHTGLLGALLTFSVRLWYPPAPGTAESARTINPQTAMPTTNVSEQDARDMAAYLYLLN
jgi:hypothetical protein